MLAEQATKSETVWETVRWWEIRRIPYNGALLFVGLATLASMYFLGGNSIPPGEDIAEPLAVLIGIPLFAIAANVCYTLGPIVSLVGRLNEKTQERLYIAGFAFSMALTFLPGIWWLILWMMVRVFPKAAV